MVDKMNDPASGRPRRDRDDPFAALFADCETAEDMLQLQRDIEAMERAEAQKGS